jgi:hypothetical protein
MRALSDSAMLDLWERGARLHSLDRGLMVLAAAFPEAPDEAPADLSLGRRNSALAEWHCAMFGPRLEAWIACPQCGEQLGLQMDARSLIAQEGSSANERVVACGRSFRLPTSRDLARVAADRDSAGAGLRLLESCCLDADGAEQWSEHDLEEVGERLAAADPLAETRLEFRCPNCAAEWYETLDIVEFIWTEMDAKAKRLLYEVHTLASAYGWTEAEILGLRDVRRSCYVRMALE